MYASESVVAYSYSDMVAGKHKPQLVFEPTKESAWQSCEIINGRAMVHYLKNVCPVIQVSSPIEEKGSTTWSPQIIQGLLTYGVAESKALDSRANESDGTLVVEYSDRLTSPTMALWKPSGRSQPDLISSN
jgi:hypothetical protein